MGVARCARREGSAAAEPIAGSRVLLQVSEASCNDVNTPPPPPPSSPPWRQITRYVNVHAGPKYPSLHLHLQSRGHARPSVPGVGVMERVWVGWQISAQVVKEHAKHFSVDDDVEVFMIMDAPFWSIRRLKLRGT